MRDQAQISIQQFPEELLIRNHGRKLNTNVLAFATLLNQCSSGRTWLVDYRA